jgi:HSP20 family molecular chaperone IbpA
MLITRPERFKLMTDQIGKPHQYFSTTPVTRGSYVPRYNIKIDGVTATYEIALPGLDKSDVSVRLEDQHLVVSTEKQHDRSGYLVASATVSPFTAAFWIGEAQVVNATMVNGLLSVSLSTQRNVTTVDIH